MSENELYVVIGEILFTIAPEDALFVIVDAEISEGGDHCKLLFDYIDSSGKKDWFSPPGAKVDCDLVDCLLSLRKVFSEQIKTNGHPVWQGCELSFDVVHTKLSVEFRYG